MGNSSSLPTLSKSVIIKTAMSIIESEGTKAFSMRRVAHSLGVFAGALYPYVGSKEKLTEALIDSLFQ